MRVRKIRFESESEQAKERFALLYQGFVTGGNGPQSKGKEVIRREARILDKMEALSIETPNARELKPGDQELVLDVPEFELLNKYFEATPWTVRMSTKIVNIIDWLAEIPVDEGG